MPKYRVNIEEPIIENRIYEIEADTPEAAARTAYVKCRVNGELPKTSSKITHERDYWVLEAEKSELFDGQSVKGHKTAGYFGTEIEEPADE